jgi:hypothetical protein
VLAALLVVAAAGQARADQIIDQQNGPPPGNASVSIPFGAPLGQSFTPSLTGIDFATFQIFDFGAGVAGTYQAEVRSGINGPLLGTSASVALPAGTGGFSSDTGATIEFDFPSTIALTPGTTFSLMLVRVDSSSNFAAIGQAGTGTYAGGAAITSPAIPFPPGDFFFSEGIIVAAVPEPATIVSVLSGVALVGLGLALAKRRQAAS